MRVNVPADDLRTEELTAAIREIQARVRARHPRGALGNTGITVADLTALLHARDAASGKVAAIGTVNPRPGGLANSVIQKVKRLVARALDWHVREQVEFNRAALACVQAILETFEENNRALAQTASYAHDEVARARSEVAALAQQAEALRREVAAAIHGEVAATRQEFHDIRTHWAQWRQGWEEKRHHDDIHVLRTISELHSSFQHRVTLLEKELGETIREALRHQHAGFEGALAKANVAIQEKLWADLAQLRTEYESLIHHELRVVRQRLSLQPPAEPRAVAPDATPSAAFPQIDWLKFADRFRGTEERIRAAQTMYTERFAGGANVLDIGCGRGEFLDAAKAAGIGARGIDLSAECVAFCKSKGLDAEVADLFTYLSDLPDRSLGGIYCSQVIEHLPAAALPELVTLAAAKIQRGALIAFETPNPECLAIFATHFYIDPTHTRPVPAPLLAFYLEEAGFGQLEVVKLSPAAETMPALADLPASVRDGFFGGLDYVVFARKL